MLSIEPIVISPSDFARRPGQAANILGSLDYPHRPDKRGARSRADDLRARMTEFTLRSD